MKKIRLGIIYGGKSTEHEVSVKSASSVLNNLNKEKYEIYEIFIDKNGNWLDKDTNLIEDVFKYIKRMDVVFPVLHGIGGEDGTIQGLFEMLNVPYVGAGVMASANGMDKVYSKVIFEKANIMQAQYVYLRKNKDKYIYIAEDFEEKENNLKETLSLITDKLSFPVFIKPSNCGSSVGINKAHNIEELEKYIEYAGKFDKKILIEENITGKEIECAVLGNEKPEASCVGEILAADEFYSYDAKYNNVKSETRIPANIPEKLQNEVKKLAVKAYKALDCKGLSRVDFFVDEKANKIYINEINTMPGFTNISMYPKLWEYSGLKYSDLLDKLIDLAIEEHNKK